jgi:hypothetical protein
VKNFGTVACAALLAGGLAAPAFAASADPAGATGSAQSATPVNNPGNAHIAQKLQADLSKAGFSDIKIMPSSFLVRAKDSSGNPVMMVINPDSITEVTEGNMGANSASNANHAAMKPNAATTSPSTNAPAKTNP